MLNWHLFFFISVDPRALNLAHGVICSQTTSSSKNLRTTWEWFVQVKDHPLGSMITLEVESIQITLKSTLNNLICMARLSYTSFDSQLLFSQQPEMWWYQKISEKKGLSFPATETKPGWIQGGWRKGWEMEREIKGNNHSPPDHVFWFQIGAYRFW